MNKKFVAVSIDSLLKTFSAVDAGESVSFQITSEDGPAISVDDCVLGFIGHGIDEFRIAFVVTEVEDDALLLSKVIERSEGVPIAAYATSLLSQLQSLASPGAIVELPNDVGGDILAKLHGGTSKVKEKIIKESLQLITYGAPGTGKSHKIDKCTNESNSIRVTFHPDTDYAAFVGAYKPFVKEEIRYGLNGTNTVAMKVGGADLTEDKISYKFVPQAFMKAYVEAWRRYTDAGLQDDAKTYYLVIEEINRGNCAQIFGDLFQLLDRADSGFSAYAITPDDDIQKFLETDKDYKLADIPLADNIKKMTEAGEKVVATAADIKTGRKLVLPPNLCIWATMNTSDQSLFPIDSAFKRRWEWEYVPIEDAGKGWQIDVDGVKYIWWSFLEKINDVIATETSSEDKQLGYFFVKAKDKVIDAKTFVSKVIFYLWGDVFKDNLPEGEAFQYTFKKDGKDDKRPIRFADFYHPETGNTKDQWRDKLLKSFLDALVVAKDASAPNASGTPDASGQGSANADGGVAEAGE